MEHIDLTVFRYKFIEDAEVLLVELVESLFELQKNQSNVELIDNVFRAMHTLKGSGAMYGFEHLSKLTHIVESVYDAIRANKLAINQDVFIITFEAVDVIQKLLLDFDLSNPETKNAYDSQIKKLDDFMNNHAISLRIKSPQMVQDNSKNTPIHNGGKSLWCISLIISENLMIRGIKLVNVFSDLKELGEFYIEHKSEIKQGAEIEAEEVYFVYLITDKSRSDIEDVFIFLMDIVKITQISHHDIFDPHYFENEKSVYINDIRILEAVHDIAEGKDVSFQLKTTNNTETHTTSQTQKREPVGITKTAMQRITVSAEKLDKLMYLVTELVTLKSQMKLSVENEDFEAIKLQVESIEKLSKDFRTNAFSIRLVPLKELTVKFKRLVYDLCNQLDKDVDFVIYGDEIELDKSIVNAISDPLMHLVRNCIDHGIETPENRIKAGKTAKGLIKLSAYQSGNYIFIQIADDGNGIDKEKIKEKAIEKKLISPYENLSDQQIFDLIFIPGFSTAEHLTSVSGRGVGMDVVKRRINELRGEINIDSETGLGASFTVKLQQTLSIMDTLLTKTGETYLMIPVDEVQECEQIEHSLVKEKFNKQIEYKENLIPFIYLREFVKIKGQIPEEEKVVIVKKQDKVFALIVDSIVGEFQAVLKPMGEMFTTQDFYTGASILGDGAIAFMLDTSKLLTNYKKSI